MATSKAQVQALQTALNRWSRTGGGGLAFDALVPDGIAGKYTLAAVKMTLASSMANPSGVLYDFITTPAILIGTDGLVVNLTDLFNRSADTMNVPPAKAIPAAKTTTMVATSGGRISIPTSQLPATAGRDQSISAGMLGLGLPNWAVYAGGVGLVAVIGLMIVKRKKPGGVDGVRHKARQNAYGLTWVKWFRAAGFPSEQKALNAGDTMDAWYRGEDPSDWRAEQQR